MEKVIKQDPDHGKKGERENMVSQERESKSLRMTVNNIRTTTAIITMILITEKINLSVFRCVLASL